jgi:hypothetical protein
VSDTKAFSGAGGTVKIGDLAVYVEQIPFSQQVGLLEDLRRLAKSQAGDYLKVIEPVLDRLAKDRSAEATARAAIFIETVARMEARQELPGEDAAETARRTPKGVALEIWHRSRRLHSSITLRELEAVIVGDETARTVHRELREAIGEGDESKS